MRVVVCLSVAFVLAACDTAPGAEGDASFVYATDGLDIVSDLIQVPGGDLVVVGSTEGTPRPGGYTIGLPSVLRFGLNGKRRGTEVYRTIDYGSVVSVAPVQQGLVLGVNSRADNEGGARTFGVFRADGTGRLGVSLLQPDVEPMPDRGLVSMSDGGFIAAVNASAAINRNVVRLSASGDVLWGTRMDGVYRIGMVVVDAGGSVYASGTLIDGDVIARFDGSTGAELWRYTPPREWYVTALATTTDGVAVLENRVSAADGSVVRVVWLGTDGQVLRTRVVDTAPGSEGGTTFPETRVEGASLASLRDGGIAVGVRLRSSRLDHPAQAQILHLASDGTERSRRRFGVAGRWTDLNAMVTLADGRVAAAGSVGPERVSPYELNDFDIWVALYDLDGSPAR